MLQLPFIRENRELTLDGLRKKYVANPEETINTLLDMDQRRRSIQQELETILAQQNGLAKQIGVLMKEGRREEADAAKTETTSLKTRSKNLEEQLLGVEADLHTLLVTLPNLPHASVPEGRTAEENEEIFSWGEKPTLPADALPHWELIK